MKNALEDPEMRGVDMARILKKTRSRTGKTWSLQDIKGMVQMLKSLYSPTQLREIVDGLNLPAAEHTCSGTRHNNEKE
jgi:hypothetical protein